MTKIIYTTGDATSPGGTGNKIIVHICNDIGGWGKGFVLALSKKWKAPEDSYRSWYRGETEIPFELGQVQFVKVENNILVANLLAQHDIIPRSGIPPVRYDAVRQCLEKVAMKALSLNASVHMPRIGCGLAGGKWEEIEIIVSQTLISQGIEVTVYDLPRQSDA